MVKYLFPTLMVLFTGTCLSQPSMFRGNPAHDSYTEAPEGMTYDSQAWRFDAGSPVRSTPLVDKKNVYFGTAAGEFCAIERATGKLVWKFSTGKAVHSSPASQEGRIFFSDNGQTVYCLQENNGGLLWQLNMGPKREYPWRYDYTYSSPVLFGNKLFIGGDDGYFYCIDQKTGKLTWKFQCSGIVRSTGAIYHDLVMFGDTDATFYAVDINTGKQRWQFRILGYPEKNEDYGFDRRAITSSPVIAGNRVIFGARDGLLYCLNADDGKEMWNLDYHITWVMSTAAVRDSLIVTATSDGHYVNAVNLYTGKETWRALTPLAVWSSPLIVRDKVYAGTFDGHLYCLDLKTGRRVSLFKAGGKIISSPVWKDGLLFVGSDDGFLYALQGHTDRPAAIASTSRFVYYEAGVNAYFRDNSDLVTRNYLRGNGYKVIGPDSLAEFLSKDRTEHALIVFATCHFPEEAVRGGNNSPIRKFLDQGGRIVLTGTNPLVYQFDKSGKTPVAFRPHATDSVFSLDYGPGDTRSFRGDITSFPTTEGKQYGLPSFWSSSLFIAEKNVDQALGRNENGDVSAYIKNYNNGGKLIQIWLDADHPTHLDAVVKVGEW